MNLVNDEIVTNLRAKFAVAQEAEATAKKAYNEAHDTAHALRKKLIHLMYGLEPGKTVLLKNERTEEKYLFEAVVNFQNWTPDRALLEEEEHRHWGRPWATGRKIRKDGNPSDRVTALYTDWKVCEEK